MGPTVKLLHTLVENTKHSPGKNHAKDLYLLRAIVNKVRLPQHLAGIRDGLRTEMQVSPQSDHEVKTAFVQSDLEFDEAQQGRVRDSFFNVGCTEGGITLRYLTPEEYPLWDDLLDASPQGSVFCRSWWLKATDTDVRVLGCFEKGRLVAGIPLYVRKRFGIKLCVMPNLTQTWGVVVEPLQVKTASAASREMEILRIFARNLAQHRFFFQAFHPNLQNWLPFYWNGFKQTSRCTYVLDDLSDVGRIWKEMSGKVRGDIRKAEKADVKLTPCDADLVFEAVAKTFGRQQMKIPYSGEYLRRLYQAAKAHDSGECFAAQDGAGRVHAAAFLIWDRKRSYYLVGGGDPQLRNSGATSLLIWHMIQFSAKRTAVFDFEGSVVESIERLFRKFGAKQVHYNYIIRLPALVRIYLGL